jgi:hypothetical protein
MKAITSKETNWQGTIVGRFYPVESNYKVEDPQAVKSLGTYPSTLIVYNSERENKYSYRAELFYEINRDKYDKLQGVFNNNTTKMQKGQTVYFMKDLSTPSQNFTQMLHEHNCKRVRKMSTADIIVIPKLPKVYNDRLYKPESGQLVHSNLYCNEYTAGKSLEDFFGHDTKKLLRASWWSKSKNVFDQCLEETLTSTSKDYEQSTDTVFVAGGIMEALYHHLKNGKQVYIEEDFVETHANREPINMDTADMIIKLLKSPVEEDRLMGATVFAESDFYSDAAKPYSYYILTQALSSLRDYNRFKNVRNIFRQLNINEWDETPTAHLLDWYKKEGIELPNDMKSNLIKSIINEYNHRLHYTFRQAEFTKYFDITIDYKEE